MNLGGKQDLDALLEGWPAPKLKDAGERPATADLEQDEERTWEERADAIVKAALASRKEGASGEALGALLAAPALVPEPGESGAAFLSGEKKMEQVKEPGDSVVDDGASPPLMSVHEGGAAPKPVALEGSEARKSAPDATPMPRASTSPPADRKRSSLKEMAARASQAGASRPSSPGTPAASSTGSKPAAPVAPAASAASGRPSTATPLPRPVEAGKDDSGVINLDVVRATATAQQVAAAEKAKPAQAGLFEDDKTVESAADAGSAGEKPTRGKPTKVAVVEAKKSNNGALVGIAIAVLGMAAAYAIVHKKAAPQTTPVAVEARPVVAPPSALPQAAPTATAVASAESTASPTAHPGSDEKPAEPAKGVVAVAPQGTGTAASKDAPAGGKLAASGAPATTGKPGDLQSEMARAVGPSKDGDQPSQALPAPEPASGGAKNQNIPEQPSQGSVQAAVGSVMGGAKACVAGADDISRAQVTFSSSGSVTSVSVTGWAAAHGKSGCIQAALKGAKVGAFSKPSFTVGVPIRP